VSAALAIGLGGAIAAAAPRDPGPPPEVAAAPVHAKPVAPGVRLTVHVFPAGNARGARPSPAGDICLDGDQSGHARFAGARREGLTMRIDGTFAPSGVAASAPAAIDRSLDAWDAVIPGDYFTASHGAGPRGPAQDGTNVIGWARLVPKTTLAAAWTYTDAATNRVLEADVFFNTQQPWGVLSACNSASAYDVEGVGTHEVGHILGLEHVSDAARVATMYPSAPRGEIRKRTLTSGDAAGALAALE
jgi:hypothetical protein